MSWGIANSFARCLRSKLRPALVARLFSEHHSTVKKRQGVCFGISLSDGNSRVSALPHEDRSITALAFAIEQTDPACGIKITHTPHLNG